MKTSDPITHSSATRRHPVICSLALWRLARRYLTACGVIHINGPFLWITVCAAEARARRANSGTGLLFLPWRPANSDGAGRMMCIDLPGDTHHAHEHRDRRQADAGHAQGDGPEDQARG